MFILVFVLCEFAMVPGVYVLLFPEEEDVHIPEHIYQKDSNLLLPLSYSGKVFIDLEKKINEEFNCVLMLIICSTLKFQFFFFFWAIFWYYVLKISDFIFGLWLYDFRFCEKDNFTSPLIMKFIVTKLSLEAAYNSLYKNRNKNRKSFTHNHG